VKEDEVGDCKRDEEDVDAIIGERVAMLSSLVGAIEPLELGVGVPVLLIDAVSTLSLSPLFVDGLFFSFPAPTAPRIRLYNPLSPFCMISPAIP